MDMTADHRNFHFFSSLTGFFTLLLFAIFTFEMAIMELLDPLFSRSGRFFAGLVDASLLTLLLALPLWFLFIRPRFGKGGSRTGAGSSAGPLLAKTLAAIFLADFLVMMVLPEITPRADPHTRGLVDACLTTLLSGPLLWQWLCVPEIRPHTLALSKMLATPLGLYLLLLFLIFLGYLLQELLLPLFFGDFPRFTHHIIDAFLSTLFVAPLFWLFVARPLKRAALSERARARAVQAQVIDAIATVDSTGAIASFNPAAARIFGYRPAEVAGKTAAMLLDLDERRLEETLLAAAMAGRNGEAVPVIHELPGKKKDGSQLIMDVTVSRVSVQGQEEFLLIMRDITARREMERDLLQSKERFRQILEQSEDAIIFFKPGSCSIIDANKTAEKLYGYDRDELKTAGMEAIIAAGDLPRVQNVIRHIHAGGGGELEMKARHKNGKEFIVTMRGKVMTLQAVDIVHCTFRDVTERFRMEKEARDIQAKLIQANKMTSLGLMVSGVAHEINNPNNFILANAQLLERSWQDARKILHEYHQEHGDFLLGGIPFARLDAHSPELFAGILDGSRRINDIVRNLKSFARQESGDLGGELDVNQVVTAAVTILHHELVRFTENFQVDLEDRLPRIHGARQQIGQVIINLLMNACQALPDKHHGIRLATSFDAQAGQVIITVRDEGEGMTREDGARIMEPFFTTKLETGGTGLGLSICRSIIQDHQGVLEFVSELGKGSTFSVKLPVNSAAKGANG